MRVLHADDVVVTPEPQTRTLSLEGLGDIDGTYAPEHWTETAEGLLASHTTPSGARLKVKLVLTADPSPSGTLTLTRPPRQARYTLNETTGVASTAASRRRPATR